MLDENYYENSLKDYSRDTIPKQMIDFILILLRHAYTKGQKDGIEKAREVLHQTGT